MKIDYKEYIKSNKWKKKRKELIDSIGYACEQCGVEHHLHVHHKTYKNLGNEPLKDLQLLCRMCHLSKHDHNFEKVFKTKKKTRKKKPKRKLSLKQKFKMLETPKGRKALRKRGYKF